METPDEFLATHKTNTDLPDTNNSVGDEDEQDDEGFHESGDGIIVFKEGQYLKNTKVK